MNVEELLIEQPRSEPVSKPPSPSVQRIEMLPAPTYLLFNARSTEDAASAARNCSQKNCSAPGSSDHFLVHARYIFTSIYVLIFLVGLPGNLLMLLVLLQDLRRTSTEPLSRLTAPLIINITVSDLVFLAYCIPLMFLNLVTMEWRIGYMACLTHPAVCLWSNFSSFYSMLAVSVLRYLAVVHPTRSRTLSQKLIAWICLLIWLMSFSVSVPLWLHSSVVKIHGVMSCILLMSVEQITLYSRLLAGVAFFPPMSLMVLGYLKVIHSLWSRKSLIVHTASSLQVSRKATIMILTMVMSFILTWVPCWLLIFITGGWQSELTPTLYVVTNLTYTLAFSSCCISPIIYFSLSDQFRTRLWKLLRAAEKSKTSSAHTENTETFDTVKSSLDSERTLVCQEQHRQEQTTPV
ncbi:galanin receptor type 2-like [Rhinatrema bivittatum]|uniref:galanin receptor type 2-like n=1 Tax=Rhinatrema bivittatum TaxID=194408 RepID=UPI001126C2D8|nr:galanin receptor type 2-like [Rhinatrema bivittatum]